MNKIYSLSLLLALSISLSACGTKGKDKEGGNDLGKTGQNQGDGNTGGGGGGGNGPTNEEVLRKNCAAVNGTIVGPNACRYVKFKTTVPSPQKVENEYQFDLGMVHAGMILRAIGDPTEAASIYVAQGSRLIRIAPIGGSYTHIVLPVAGRLTLVAYSTYEKPAQVSVYECMTAQRDVTACAE